MLRREVLMTPAIFLVPEIKPTEDHALQILKDIHIQYNGIPKWDNFDRYILCLAVNGNGKDINRIAMIDKKTLNKVNYITLYINFNSIRSAYSKYRAWITDELFKTMDIFYINNMKQAYFKLKSNGEYSEAIISTAPDNCVFVSLKTKNNIYTVMTTSLAYAKIIVDKFNKEIGR